MFAQKYLPSRTKYWSVPANRVPGYRGKIRFQLALLFSTHIKLMSLIVNCQWSSDAVGC